MSLLMRFVAVELVGLRTSPVGILVKYCGAREVSLIALALYHLSRFPSSLISTPGSSLEYLGIHRNTHTTSPLHRPEEVVLMAPDGSLDASERTAE